MLSLLHHPNLMNLIGYCADGDQRLLVYEFMPLGSLEDHLLGKVLFLLILFIFLFALYVICPLYLEILLDKCEITAFLLMEIIS